MVSYIVREPSIILWWRAHSQLLTKATSFVWVIEDDVVYTGSLQAFLASYAAETADLVSLFCANGSVGGCTDASGWRQLS